MKTIESTIRELRAQRAKLDAAIAVLAALNGADPRLAGFVREGKKAVAEKVAKARTYPGRTRAMSAVHGVGLVKLGVMRALASSTVPLTYREIVEKTERPPVYERRRLGSWKRIVKSTFHKLETSGYVKIDRARGRFNPSVACTPAGRAWFQKVSTAAKQEK